MPDIELSLSVNIGNALSGFDKVQQKLAETATEAVKIDSALDHVSKSMNSVVPSANKMAASFESVSAEVFSAADAFNAKWNPVVAQAAQEAAKTTVQVNKLAVSVAKFGGGVAAFTPNFKAFGAQIPKAGEALKNVKPNSDKATQALTNLGRVVSDAPFGFIGIANNIEPLFESFNRLKASTGSTGGALKALAGTLAGPTGILFGITTVTSLLIAFGDELFSSAKNVNELTDAMAGAAGAAQGEISNLNALLSVARDTAQSTETRKNAIAELNKEYPAYQNNLTLENINSQNATKATDLLTEAITRKAQAQALSNLLTKANEDLFKAQNEQLGTNVGLWQGLKAILKTGGTGAAGVSVITNSIEDQSEAVGELQKNIDKWNKQLIDLKANQAAAGDFKLLTPDAIKKIKDVQTASDVLNDLAKQLKDLNTIQTGIGGDMRSKMISAIDSTVEALVRLGVAAEDPRLQNLLHLSNQISKSFFDISAPVEKVTEDLTKLSKDVSKDIPPIKVPVDFQPIITEENLISKEDLDKINKILSTAVEDSLAALGEGIGNAISGTGSLFTPLVELLGGVLTQLGKTLIGMAIGLEAIQIALKSLNPVIAAAAGVALVALGAIVKNSVKEMAFAQGGIVTGPTHALIGEAGAEAVLPLDRLSEFMTGGGQQLVVLETRISGDDIFLTQQRTSRRRGRSY